MAVIDGRTWPELLEHLAMLAMLAIWAVPFTKATGGRGVHNELLFAAALLLILPAVGAWRGSTGSVVLAATTAVAALLVCVFAPSGWYGSDVAVGYAIAAAAFIVARRYVRDAERRTLVAASICVAGLYEFSQSFTAWWGSRSAATEMSGTFYWHNPYAAFLLPGALLGIGLVLTRRSPWTIVGWVTTPICTAGIVFSSSRATMAVVVVGFVLVLALGVRSRADATRGAGIVAATAGVILVLPGPPFFPHYTAPWAGTAERAASQSLAQNGGFRTEFWREALQVALHHPLVGSGFHVLATASALYTPSGWARSPQAHDGYLQALSDGGLLLGVPFLCAVAVALFWGLRQLRAGLRRSRGGQAVDIVGLSAAIALLGAMAHSAVDFDWSHPSILVEFALLAACVAPVVGPHRAGLWARGVALVAVCGVLGISISALHQWQIDQPNEQYSTSHLLAEANAPLGDFRPAKAVLSDAAYGDRVITAGEAARALALTDEEAKVDVHLALLRDAVGAQFGLISDPVAAAQHELRHITGSTAPYVLDLALVELEAGDKVSAAELLTADIAGQSAVDAGSPVLQSELELWARRLGVGEAYACEVATARPLLEAQGDTAKLPQPSSACRAGDQGRG
jgi:hypothetical protein